MLTCEAWILNHKFIHLPKINKSYYLTISLYHPVLLRLPISHALQDEVKKLSTCWEPSIAAIDGYQQLERFSTIVLEGSLIFIFIFVSLQASHNCSDNSESLYTQNISWKNLAETQLEHGAGVIPTTWTNILPSSMLSKQLKS